MAKISLFGYGKTTRAIAKNLGGANIYDDNVHKPFYDEDNNHVLPVSAFEAEYSPLEIPSPSFNPNHTLIKKAKHLISEYDYFSESMPFSVWVSGTNGKTTTTQMITHLLTCRGAISGGNIGTPLAEMDNNAPIWVLETSSYTFHYTTKAKPNIYVLLDITPDHLSWHGSFEAYEKAKLQPLAQMNEGEIIILPKKYEHIKSNGACVYYESAEDLAHYFDIDISKIAFKGAFLIDALLAMAVDRILFDSCDYDKINAFSMEAHRQEKVLDVNNRVWINDSKATNVEATLAAFSSFSDKSIHLILGGDDKGVDLEPLFIQAKELDITIYAIGVNHEKIASLSNKHEINCFTCKELALAIETIAENMGENDIALLSPAAASFDQFSSYIDRGEQFKQFVSKLSRL